MGNLLGFFYHYYYLVLIVQVICAIHCIRKGNQAMWLWLIIFLPAIGCILYIFTEIFTKEDIGQVQSGVGAVFNPSGKIKKLQNNVKFRDTFDNRIALADAYLDAGQADRAIEIYESSLTGTFDNHEYGNIQLVKAYFEKQRYEDVFRIVKKVYHVPQFKRSRAQILYAKALGLAGRNEEAETEFRSMNGKFSNYENRYEYAKFMIRNSRIEEAKNLLREMVNETSHLDAAQKRFNKTWLGKIKEELKSVESV